MRDFPDSAIGTIGQPGKSDTPYEIRRAFIIMTGGLAVTGVSAAEAAVWHKSDGIAPRLRPSTDPFPLAEREVNPNNTNLTNKDGRVGYRVIVRTCDHDELVAR